MGAAFCRMKGKNEVMKIFLEELVVLPVEQHMLQGAEAALTQLYSIILYKPP